MAKKSISPIVTWVFWSILVLGAFLAVTWEYFVAGFAADTSKITWLILAFFFYGFIVSLRVAIHLELEFKSLKAMEAEERVGDANSSDAAAMFDSAMERIRRGERIEVRNLITAYSGKLKAKVDNIGVVAGMLITMGLLGTVIGLIITVTGLDQVLQSSSADFASMKAGLNQTVSGMGTAFYTTFFGALLGGVVLKVLGAEMKKSATILVADTLRFSELYLAPLFQAKASESLTELEDRINLLHGQLGALGTSLGAVVETIDSKQTALQGGLESLLGAIHTANEQSVERADALMKVVGGTIEETSRQADERLSVLTSTIATSSEQANERSNALVSAINQTIEATNRMADERLQALVKTIESSAESTHQQADAQLANLVGTVEKSLESASKNAETRLDAKASDLANKLNEAASMLSGLMSPASSPETTDQPEGGSDRA